jgi:hypothetical protein
MSEDNFVIQKFSNKQAANHLLNTLNEKDLKCRMIRQEAEFPAPLSSYTSIKYFTIVANEHDSTSIKKTINDMPKPKLSETPRDHYLLIFSNEELFNVLKTPDLWINFDYELAKQILSNRGVEIFEKQLEEYKITRNILLSNPEKIKKWYIYGTYLLAITYPLTIFCIEKSIINFKKITPEGNLIYAYEREDRKNGRIARNFSIVYWAIFLLTLIFKI